MIGRRWARARTTAGVAALAGLLVLAACTSSAGNSPSAAPSASTPAAGGSSSAAATTITIVERAGNVTPNGQKLDVAQGTRVDLAITSDADDEIHAHTAGNGYEVEVKAGQPAHGSFVASDIGSFEIESHHLNKIIVILNVR
jgi:hypothetical protein